MKLFSPLTYKMVAHTAVPNFNVDECVDWAHEMITLGYETEYVLILAGLTKPVNYFEAIGYLNAALTALNIQVKIGHEALISYSSYYIIQIANGKNVKMNLSVVTRYHLETNYEPSIHDFCLLSWAWDDLEWRNEKQYYWEDADLSNIEQIAIDTANKWLVENKMERA